MNRRDLLKALGIGGLMPFVGKEAEAATPEIPAVQPQLPSSLEGKGSISYQSNWPACSSDTASVWIPERSYFGGRQSWEYIHGGESHPTVTISGHGVDAQIEGYYRVDDFGGDE